MERNNAHIAEERRNAHTKKMAGGRVAEAIKGQQGEAGGGRIIAQSADTKE